MKKALLDKISNQDAVIGIVGMGYVGLPLMLSFYDAGFRTIGFDINETNVEKINNGESYIHHISSDRIKKAINENLCKATSDFSCANDCDVIILCVPTPLNKNREPDLSFIDSSLAALLPYLKKGQLLSLESTTYPGTTDEKIVCQVESKGFKVGEDFFVVYSPEREDPGSKNYSNKIIPKLCGGYSKNCLELGIAIYEKAISEIVPVSSTKAAEMTKLLENIHRAVNIGLVNEMKVISDKMGIDIFEVIDAAATKPFGFTPYYPGPGIGGHCIPIDPFYLSWKAKEYGINARFIEIAGEVNELMHDYVISKLNEALNLNSKCIKGSKLLILGMAYKKNIDDVRESPSVHIMKKLIDNGAKVDYSDPYVSRLPRMRKFNFSASSKNINKQMLKEYDAVLILTDHDDFEYNLIKENSKIIIDSRGRFRESSSNIFNA